MLSGDRILTRNTEYWSDAPSYTGILPFDQKVENIISKEEINSIHCLNVGLKEETEEYERDLLSDAENTLQSGAPTGSVVPECIKVEINKPNDQNDAPLNKSQRIHLEKLKPIYPWLCPSQLENFGEKLPLLKLCSDPVQQIKKGRQSQMVQNRVLRLQALEAQRILRREVSRRRRAHKRALETEEERNLRREKERLAKAAKRAAEPLEKRLMRRERDRIAKALSRAAESEEERSVRREKNRLAMAALRAAQTEEERFIRREKDRIKKATVRAFETEEQKRLRREKNRVAMSIRRANLSECERNYLRSRDLASRKKKGR